MTRGTAPANLTTKLTLDHKGRVPEDSSESPPTDATHQTTSSWSTSNTTESGAPGR